MSRPPRPTQEPIIDRKMLLGFLVQSSALAGSILGIFALGLYQSDAQVAGTMAFATLVLAELFRAYSVRSEEIPVLQLGWHSNRFMQGAVMSSVALLLLVLYLPGLSTAFGMNGLPLDRWMVILPFALIPMLATESRKMIRQAWRRRTQVQQ